MTNQHNIQHSMQMNADQMNMMNAQTMMNRSDEAAQMQNGPYAMGEMPGNIPGAMPAEMNNMQNMQAAQPLTYHAIYPEIYYKLKPFIEIARDLILSCGIEMPTQKQLEEMTDGIYADFCRLHPDMANYLGKNDPPDDPPHYGDVSMHTGFRPSDGFRRRGLGRDFIHALLLAELLGRDTGFFY